MITGVKDQQQRQSLAEPVDALTKKATGQGARHGCIDLPSCGTCSERINSIRCWLVLQISSSSNFGTLVINYNKENRRSGVH